MSRAAPFVIASNDNCANATLVPSSFHKLCALNAYTRNANATAMATRSQKWFLCFRIVLITRKLYWQAIKIAATKAQSRSSSADCCYILVDEGRLGAVVGAVLTAASPNARIGFCV